MTADLAALPWADWLPRQRWFAGRGRGPASAGVHRVVPLRSGLDLTILAVSYPDGGAEERYQIVVQWDSGPATGDGVIGTLCGPAGRTAYDALYHAESARFLLSLLDSSARIGEVRFDREPGADLPVGAVARVIGAEQSNTSVVYGDAAILKLFRRVLPGVNPDIELNRALARQGNPHVARPLGSVEITDNGQTCALGTATTYAAGAVPGWEIACRGTDLTDEAQRLGAAVAAVHADLARAMGTSIAPVPVVRFRSRLAQTAAIVPQLEPYRGAIEERYDRLASQQMAVQRIHGDLHLGQVLRTPDTWLLIDFEGEPGLPLDQRRQPDSPLRDVAGMVRSFDYAGHDAAGRGAAFCAGYTAGAGADPRAQSDLLGAYVLDKAVYETGYEARHRPDWLHIPLRGIARLMR